MDWRQEDTKQRDNVLARRDLVQRSVPCGKTPMTLDGGDDVLMKVHIHGKLKEPLEITWP